MEGMLRGGAPVNRAGLGVPGNLERIEEHVIGGISRELYLHRKGATRALDPGHPDLPEALRDGGRQVPVGGSTGTAS